VHDYCKLFFKAIKPLVASALTVDVKAVLSKFSHDAVYGTDVGLFDDVQGGELSTLRQQIQNTPKAFALFNAGGVHGLKGYIAIIKRCWSSLALFLRLWVIDVRPAIPTAFTQRDNIQLEHFTVFGVDD
jgi:hypothetical protein